MQSPPPPDFHHEPDLASVPSAPPKPQPLDSRLDNAEPAFDTTIVAIPGAASVVPPISLKALAKSSGDLAESLKALAANKGDILETHAQLSRAQSALGKLRLEELADYLKTETAKIDVEVKGKLASRREKLHEAASAENWRSKRLTDYDRVELFKISYSASTVKLELGSATVKEIDEVEGNRLFVAIKQTKAELDKAPFEPDAFGRLLLAAYRAAIAEGHGRDRKIPIHTLFAFTVAIRRVSAPGYIRAPDSQPIPPYPLSQFIYDLARFGQQQGWRVGGAILRSQTPNMGAVGAGKSITLPDLNSLEARGNQIAAVSFEEVAF